MDCALTTIGVRLAMSDTPSTNGSTGRDSQGRFTVGNPGGSGNPFAARVNVLRREMLDEATSGDPCRLRKVVAKCYDMAEEGDAAAIRICIDHAIGKPLQTNVIEAGDELPLKLLPDALFERV